MFFLRGGTEEWTIAILTQIGYMHRLGFVMWIYMYACTCAVYLLLTCMPTCENQNYGCMLVQGFTVFYMLLAVKNWRKHNCFSLSSICRSGLLLLDYCTFLPIHVATV